MKFELHEGKHCLSITATPETAAEVAKLARFTKNSKRVPPNVYLSFSNDTPYMNIYMPKIDEKKQNNSISNRKI